MFLAPSKLLLRSSLCALVTLFATGAHAHNTLLPQPQQVQYDDGTISVSKLSVRYAMKPDAEDKFAADELATRLGNITGTEFPAKSHGAQTITLRRTGQGSPIPINNESVGPNSREAYTLTVGKNGAEITAASSAGLYYGVQTLIQ
ncbi:MAG: glycoside hydrolase family 20 zincin-like fold domain-containing protein, partial [Limisphaerales bacterium]